MASNDPQVIRGPDGFPYFVLQRPPVGQGFTPFCVSHILDHCTDSGFGIVIEPAQSGPQWVFTYGDLFSLRAYGTLAGDPIDLEEAARALSQPSDVVPAGSQVMIGFPSEEMMPGWARRTIAAFLQNAAHVTEPKAMLMVQPSRTPSRNLIFNVHPEDAPSQDAFKTILNALGWFLPRGRSVTAISRASNLSDGFAPLIG